MNSCATLPIEMIEYAYLTVTHAGPRRADSQSVRSQGEKCEGPCHAILRRMPPGPLGTSARRSSIGTGLHATYALLRHRATPHPSSVSNGITLREGEHPSPDQRALHFIFEL